MAVIFTIDSAEKTLPTLSRLVKQAQRVRDKLAWLIETNDAYVEVSDDDGFHYFVTGRIKTNKKFHQLYYRFYSIIERITEMGCVVEDIDEGIIVFPFKKESGTAFLSWQLGEDRIRYWHYAEEQYEDRKPIIDLDEMYENEKV